MAGKNWVRSLFGTKTRPVTRWRPTALGLEPLDARIDPTDLPYGLFDTGVNAAGTALAGGAGDPHSVITQTPAGPASVTPVVEGNPGAYGWAANTSTSAWIVPPGGTSVGTYTYQTTFTVPAGSGGYASITGSIAVHNDVTDILVNGTSTGYTLTNFASPTRFAVNANLTAGTNTLTVVTHEGGFPGGLQGLDVDFPPTLVGGGGPPTATANGTPVVVDPTLTVTDPDGPNLTRATVTIGGNYTAGDQFQFTNQNGISGSYAGGTLTLTGSATAAQYQAALRSVKLAATATGAGPRTVTFSIAPADVAPNGHVYQYVAANGIDWQPAQAAAAASSRYGMQGYLATVTSAAENGYVTAVTGGAGAFLGGTDLDVADVWRWKTGPEGLEDGGQGRNFWNGKGGGSAPNGYYANWQSGKPDDAFGEYYTRIGSDGTWDDWDNDTPFLDGYVIEYGGMPGDPTLKFTSATTVTVVAATANPMVTAPATATTVAASSYTITGTAAAGSLVQVYSDGNGNGVIDAADPVVASQQLAGGSAAFSVPTPLTPNAANHFRVTATAAGSGASAPVVVPTITDQPAVAFTTAAETVDTSAGSFSVTVTLTGVPPPEVPTTFASGFASPAGLAFDSAGNLYVTNQNSGVINKVTPGGAMTTFASGFSTPAQMIFDSAGNMYVTNHGNGVVNKITPAGVVSTYATGFTQPDPLALDAAGNLYVGDLAPNTVSKVAVPTIPSRSRSAARPSPARTTP